MTALPQAFVDMLAAQSQRPEFARLPEALASGDSSVSVRINRAKGASAGLFEGAEPVAWCDDGFYLGTRPQFTFDPALHQGLYYVQDASSMAQKAAVAHACSLLEAEGRPMRYLDACAAPGGKTTAAISALPEGSFVVANEFDPRRSSILIENIAKWGVPATVTRGDASKIKGLDSFFDIVAADVPCSGEGMMRKDAQAVEQWSPALIAECAARQHEIVDSLWRTLRPGGVFIYSTCTFNLDEDERVVARLIDEYGAEPLEIPALQRPEILGACAPYSFPAYRFLPGTVRGEGLFMAMLRKPGDADPARVKTAKIKTLKDFKLPLNGEWVCVADNNTLRAIPARHVDLNAAVSGSMHVISSGIELGEMKGRDFIPAQPLALAVALKQESYPQAELDRETALRYLRREAISLPEGTPRGIVLLTYMGKSLGFAKNLGNRANNLYPAQWRILSQIKSL